MRSSKGSVVSLFYVGIGLLITSIIIIFMVFSITEFKSQILESGIDMDVTYLEKGLNTYKLFNGAFVLITIASGSASIVASFMIKTHPIFFVFTWILTIILLLISAQYTNMWYEFASRAEFTTLLTDYPMMISVMKNLPIIMLGFATVVAIVMYSKGDEIFG